MVHYRHHPVLDLAVVSTVVPLVAQSEGSAPDSPDSRTLPHTDCRFLGLWHRDPIDPVWTRPTNLASRQTVAGAAVAVAVVAKAATMQPLSLGLASIPMPAMEPPLLGAGSP